MDLANVMSLQSLIRTRRADHALPPTERAVYENFATEERVVGDRLKRYGRAFGNTPLPNLDAFWKHHRTRYLDEHQFVERRRRRA